GIVVAQMEDRHALPVGFRLFENVRGSVETRQAGESATDQDRHVKFFGDISNDRRDGVLLQPQLAVVRLVAPHVAPVCFFAALQGVSRSVEGLFANIYQRVEPANPSHGTSPLLRQCARCFTRALYAFSVLGMTLSPTNR